MKRSVFSLLLALLCLGSLLYGACPSLARQENACFVTGAYMVQGQCSLSWTVVSSSEDSTQEPDEADTTDTPQEDWPSGDAEGDEDPVEDPEDEDTEEDEAEQNSDTEERLAVNATLSLRLEENQLPLLRPESGNSLSYTITLSPEEEGELPEDLQLTAGVEKAGECTDFSLTLSQNQPGSWSLSLSTAEGESPAAGWYSLVLYLEIEGELSTVSVSFYVNYQ